MKKLLLTILSLITLFLLVSCGNSAKSYLTFSEKETDIELSVEERESIQEALEKVTTRDKSITKYRYATFEEDNKFYELESTITLTYKGLDVDLESNDNFKVKDGKLTQHLNRYLKETIKESKETFSGKILVGEKLETIKERTGDALSFLKDVENHTLVRADEAMFNSPRGIIYKQGSNYYIKNDRGYIIFKKGNYKHFTFKAKDRNFVFQVTIK